MEGARIEHQAPHPSHKPQAAPSSPTRHRPCLIRCAPSQQAPATATPARRVERGVIELPLVVGHGIVVVHTSDPDSVARTASRYGATVSSSSFTPH